MIKRSFFALVVVVSFASHSLNAAGGVLTPVVTIVPSKLVVATVKPGVFSRMGSSIKCAGDSVVAAVKNNPKKTIAACVVVAAVAVVAVMAVQECKQNKDCKICVA